MTEENTAAEAVKESAWAFRLAGETPVYELPDASAKVLAIVSSVAVLTGRMAI